MASRFNEIGLFNVFPTSKTPSVEKVKEILLSLKDDEELNYLARLLISADRLRKDYKDVQGENEKLKENIGKLEDELGEIKGYVYSLQDEYLYMRDMLMSKEQ